MFYGYRLSVHLYLTANDSNANKTIRVADIQQQSQRKRNSEEEEWSHDNSIDEIKLALDGFR